jgi:sugar phosphate isomerase/epimerase
LSSPALAAAADFKGRELIVARAGEAEPHVDCSDEDPARIRHTVREHGLVICSTWRSPVANPYPIVSPDAKLGQVIQVHRMLDIAQQLQTAPLLLLPGRANGSIPMAQPAEYSAEVERAWISCCMMVWGSNSGDPRCGYGQLPWTCRSQPGGSD